MASDATERPEPAPWAQAAAAWGCVTQYCATLGVAEASVAAQRGAEKRAPAPAPWQPPPLIAPISQGSSWATDVADAEAEVLSAAASAAPYKREAPPAAAPPPAKKAAPAKSKAASVPLKKGQQTMMGFFKK